MTASFTETRSIGLSPGARCICSCYGTSKPKPALAGLETHEQHKGEHAEEEEEEEESSFLVGIGIAAPQGPVSKAANSVHLIKSDFVAAPSTGDKSPDNIPASNPNRRLQSYRYQSSPNHEIWSIQAYDLSSAAKLNPEMYIAATRSGPESGFTVFQPSASLSTGAPRPTVDNLGILSSPTKSAASELGILSHAACNREDDGFALHVNTHSASDHVLGVASQRLQVLHLLPDGELQAQSIYNLVDLSDGDKGSIGIARWSLHDQGKVFMCAMGKGGCSFVDLRNSKQSSRLFHWNAHALGTRCVDFAPHSSYICGTTGDDGSLRIWVVRKFGKESFVPVLDIQAHEHVVCSLRFNPQFGHLFASCGADGVVRVWDMNKLERDTKLRLEMSRATCTFPDHDDTIYDITWSRGDAFSLASVSYDGRFCVRSLPDDLKYSLLLS